MIINVSCSYAFIDTSLLTGGGGMFSFKYGKGERKLRHKRIILSNVKRLLQGGFAIMAHTISQFSQKELNAYGANSPQVDSTEKLE